MICEICKTRNNYYHNYCSNCGAHLKKDVVQLDDSSAISYHDHIVLNDQRGTYNPIIERQKRKRTLTSILLIAAGIVVVATAYFIFVDILG